MSISDVRLPGQFVMAFNFIVFKNWTDALFVNLDYGGWARPPFFIDYKSYTVVPGIAVVQDFLKVLFEVELGSESNA